MLYPKDIPVSVVINDVINNIKELYPNITEQSSFDSLKNHLVEWATNNGLMAKADGLPFFHDIINEAEAWFEKNVVYKDNTKC